MMIYKVKAIDQLFFRSPAPFEAGGGSQFLASYFPPIPSTYAGAFRMFDPDLTKDGKAKRLRVGYNGLLYQGAFCFPQPLDLLTISESDGEEEAPFDSIQKHYDLEKLIIKKAPPSNFPLDYYLVREKPKAGDDEDKETDEEEGKKNFPEDLYISKQKLEAYLNEDNTPLSGFSLSDHLTKEAKLGIEIGKDGITEEGMLYQIEMIRPKDKDDNDWELAVDVRGIKMGEKSTYVRLGGEAKVAQIKELNQTLDLEIAASDSECFKLYFATPAIFKNGWLPRWIKEDMTGSFSYKGKKVKVELLAAAVGKSMPIGGFGNFVVKDPDKKKIVHKARPREMRYAIPAGSVYYFKIIEGDFDKVKELFHQKCISDYREDSNSKGEEAYGFSRPMKIFDRLIYCDRGFGYAFVGAVTKE